MREIEGLGTLVDSLYDCLREDERPRLPVGHPACLILADFVEPTAPEKANLLRTEQVSVETARYGRVYFTTASKVVFAGLAKVPDVDDSDDPIASPLQIRIAWELARDHGHSWGGLDLPHNCALTSRQIEKMWEDAEAVGKVCRGVFAGITAPYIARNGNDVVISHTTASGRCSWDICQEATIVDISRPQGRVLEMRIPHDPAVSVEVTVHHENGYCERHDQTARNVLGTVSAVIGRDTDKDTEVLDSISGILADPAYRGDEPFPRFGRTRELNHPGWIRERRIWCVQDGRDSAACETEDEARRAWVQLVRGRAGTATEAVGRVRRQDAAGSAWLDELQEKLSLT